MPAGRPGVFLDRDGTIIEERDYLADPEGVRLLPGAADAITRLNRLGVPIIVVTNQSGIGRGMMSEEDYLAVKERMEAMLLEEGASVTDTYYCPHSPDLVPPCDCRKPLPGMFRRAAQKYELDLTLSHFVGDRARDVEAGVAAGGRGYLIRNEREEPPDLPRTVLVDSLAEAVELILGELARRDEARSASTG